jgi:LysM repeat protein
VPGDTLRDIAEGNNVSVSQLLELNELDDGDAIRIGQVVKVPRHVRLYVVQAGDTLGDVAAATGAERGAILALNDLDNPDLLRPGQELRVP